ncbi:histidine kinase [Enemella evansiae]|uniref:Histidine kinase n=1 Tax=Enemella evansiae TaxID=2016499 RepID=A0A255GBF5_9ACTN|nr:GAF domain-containing protein [Enemella evansiae]OYO09283.1 histidine kinase [Enemella evansiae]OYO13247.1 histidine kinase [Enemella evansiae]
MAPAPGDPSAPVEPVPAHQQRRLAAVARAAANLAAHGPLDETLNALAAEIVETDALPGVQIFTVDESGHYLRLMGSAGFSRWPDFLERLLACQRRGARLRMLEVLRSGEPVITQHRGGTDLNNPDWAPLHDYLRELNWDSWASMPLLIRGRVAGVLNVFLAPGQGIGRRQREFLLAMADHAAVAVEFAALLDHERATVRQQERVELAHDLHDSVVQQVFSIGLQARSLELLARGTTAPAPDQVARLAGEVGELARHVLDDLRAMVDERHITGTEFADALHQLADGITRRFGLRIELDLEPGLGETISEQVTKDAYLLIAEGLHNVAKHAAASTAVIRVGTTGNLLRITMVDDGRGLTGHSDTAGGGIGVHSMRERAQRWQGDLTIGPGTVRGTELRAWLRMPPRESWATTGVPIDTEPGVGAR